jgi:hypothetical protein
MKRIKKIIGYIFRGWDKEGPYIHPGLKILPPFFYELLAYLIALGILLQIGLYLFSIN